MWLISILKSHRNLNFGAKLSLISFGTLLSTGSILFTNGLPSKSLSKRETGRWQEHTWPRWCQTSASKHHLISIIGTTRILMFLIHNGVSLQTSYKVWINLSCTLVLIVSWMNRTHRKTNNQQLVILSTIQDTRIPGRRLIKTSQMS